MVPDISIAVLLLILDFIVCYTVISRILHSLRYHSNRHACNLIHKSLIGLLCITFVINIICIGYIAVSNGFISGYSGIYFMIFITHIIIGLCITKE